jgi:adenosine deaminase
MKRRHFLAVTAGVVGYAIAEARPQQAGVAAAKADADVSWRTRLPKVELHIHIEGAIPKPALWQLVTKYGGDPTVPTFEAFERRFDYRGLGQFFKAFDWATSFVREAEDFTFIGREIARDFSRQNIRYVEAHFSPTVFRQRLTPRVIAEALRKGLDQVPAVDIRLVAELGRNLGPDGAMRTVEQVGELRTLKVIGVGLGGFEPQFPNELFAAVFERARGLGLRTTAHAGESAGAPSVWGAIRALRVDRVGHATRAVEDPALVRYLAETRIPLELCPLSNVRTAVVPAIANHPLRRYFDLGIPVSLNTDDPLFFGNSLAGELAAAQEAHEFSREEIKRLITSAIDASWLAASEKTALVKQFRGASVWNEAGGRS